MFYFNCGEFLVSRSNRISTSDFVRDMRQRFQQLHPVNGTRHGRKPLFVFKDLKTVSHVFVRVDTPKPSLDPPYEGPFTVISRHTNYFRIEMRGKQVVVVLNRIKPAYGMFENSDPPSPMTTPPQQASTPVPQHATHATEEKARGTTTRFGRRVRFPDRLQMGVS